MNENEINRIAAAVTALRPDWPIASVRTLITDKLASRTRRDVAVALAWVACESESKTPARVLEAGPWWQASNAEGSATVSHTGKTLGQTTGDPRQVCGICDMWRADCESRSATNGHGFIPRTRCLPPTEVGPTFNRGRCLAGPPESPCRLITGHDGQHDCPPAALTTTRLAHRETEPETDQPKEGDHA